MWRSHSNVNKSSGRPAPGSSVQGVSRPLSTRWTPYMLSGVWPGQRNLFSWSPWLSPGPGTGPQEGARLVLEENTWGPWPRTILLFKNCWCVISSFLQPGQQTIPVRNWHTSTGWVLCSRGVPSWGAAGRGASGDTYQKAGSVS